MSAVVIDPPGDVIAERQRLGLDLFDEVWDGEYHMVPAPSWEHQRLVTRLVQALLPVADALGLETIHEFNVLPPGAADFSDFRVPDLVVFDAAVAEQRAVMGGAALVVEIRSPGDESFAKLPFFERVGVGEVLIVDRDDKAVRRWVRGPAGLVERAPDPAGRHHLRCLPVAVSGSGGRLEVATARSLVRI
jgi:Uma2 family endonuclease